MTDPAKRLYTVANALSFGRLLLLIPLFVFLRQGKDGNGNLWAIGVMGAALLTDWLDGLIARHFRQVSDWGKVLDPLADKIWIGFLALFLAMPWREHPLPLGFFLLLIVRDLAIVGTAIYVYRRIGTILTSNWFGKVAMVAEAMTLLWYTVYWTHPAMPALSPAALMWVTTLLIVISSVSYIYRLRAVLAAARQNPASHPSDFSSQREFLKPQTIAVHPSHHFPTNMGEIQDMMVKVLERHASELVANLVIEKFEAYGIRLSPRQRKRIKNNVAAERVDKITIREWRFWERKILSIDFSSEELAEIERKISGIVKDLADELEPLSDEIADDILTDMKARWPRERRIQANDRVRFQRNLAKQWKAPFDGLAMMLALARELSMRIGKDAQESATDDNRHLVEVLVLLHARACQVADEIITCSPLVSQTVRWHVGVAYMKSQ